MSKGPESNFWSAIKQKLPKEAFATRIENKHGGGVPDVHIVWKGFPFWMELKVAKSNKLSVSPHQVAWHMAYYARGGLSFFLVNSQKEGSLFLFRGEEGPRLKKLGLSAPCALRVCGPAALFCALRPVIEGHYSATLRTPYHP